MTTTKEPSMLTVKEVAKLMKVSVREVWRWTKDEGLKHYRFGIRTIRISKADLEAFMEAKKRGNGGKA